MVSPVSEWKFVIPAVERGHVRPGLVVPESILVVRSIGRIPDSVNVNLGYHMAYHPARVLALGVSVSGRYAGSPAHGHYGMCQVAAVSSLVLNGPDRTFGSVVVVQPLPFVTGIFENGLRPVVVRTQVLISSGRGLFSTKYAKTLVIMT